VLLCRLLQLTRRKCTQEATEVGLLVNALLLLYYRSSSSLSIRPLIRTEVIYEATPETKVDAKINHDLNSNKRLS
jgi:hypothetical protein